MRGMRLINGVASIAMFAGLGALIWFAVGVPLMDWRQNALAARPKAIADVQQLQERIADLQVERAQMSNNGELGVLWRAAQTGEATARIQSELSQLASARGVSLRSISPTRTRDLSLAEAAGFRLEMEASLDQLTAFLRDLEYNAPALLVEKASLRRLNKPNADQPQPLIFVQLEVSAPVQLDQGTGQ